MTNKGDFRKEIFKKPLAAIPILLFCLNKNSKYVFPLFSILYMWTLFIAKFFTMHASLFLRHIIQKTKEHILHNWGIIVFCWKKKFCTFFYISKIFFTMLHLKIFLKYWIILYIFRISLFVTSPLEVNSQRSVIASVQIENILLQYTKTILQYFYTQPIFHK